MHEDFRRKLEYSNEASDDAIFDKYYLKKFDHVLRIEKATDKASQVQGIDKIIYQTNDRTVTIDEKKRTKNWGDIAIEVFHVPREPGDRKPMTMLECLAGRKPLYPGWIWKNNCDFINYIIMPTRMFYLLPFKLLVVAINKRWEKWGEEKEDGGYGVCVSKDNPTYWSVNVIPPPDILLDALKDEMTDSFEGPEFPRGEAVRFFTETNGQIAFKILRSL